MNDYEIADELRELVARFDDALLTLSAVTRFRESVLLIADRVEGEAPRLHSVRVPEPAAS